MRLHGGAIPLRHSSEGTPGSATAWCFSDMFKPSTESESFDLAFVMLSASGPLSGTTRKPLDSTHEAKTLSLQFVTTRRMMVMPKIHVIPQLIPQTILLTTQTQTETNMTIAHEGGLDLQAAMREYRNCMAQVIAQEYCKSGTTCGTFSSARLAGLNDFSRFGSRELAVVGSWSMTEIIARRYTRRSRSIPNGQKGNRTRWCLV